MKKRCVNPNASDFRYYGGRGIKLSRRWLRFENFLADMGERPLGKTIDRKDPNGNYTKRNCKWSTRKEQRANQRKKAQ